MFDWAGYLDVAEVLVTRDGGEAAERSAISRAYYACYGLAWAYASSKRASLTGTGRDHQILWQWFIDGHGNGPIHLGVGSTGKRLKGWRIQADYRPTQITGVSKTARVAVIAARRLLQDLAALP